MKICVIYITFDLFAFNVCKNVLGIRVNTVLESHKISEIPRQLQLCIFIKRNFKPQTNSFSLLLKQSMFS